MSRPWWLRRRPRSRRRVASSRTSTGCGTRPTATSPSRRRGGSCGTRVVRPSASSGSMLDVTHFRRQEEELRIAQRLAEGGQRGQVPVPGQHEPRAPDAVDHRDRGDRDGHGRSSQPVPAAAAGTGEPLRGAVARGSSTATSPSRPSRRATSAWTRSPSTRTPSSSTRPRGHATPARSRASSSGSPPIRCRSRWWVTPTGSPRCCRTCWRTPSSSRASAPSPSS